MKRKIAILLVFVFTVIIHGVALADGGGLPPPPPSPPGDATGPYVKGYFTIACDKANPGQYTHHDLHAVLDWDRARGARGMVRGIERGKPGSFDLKKFTKRATPAKEVHLFSAAITMPQSANLCSYTDDHFKRKYFSLPSQLGIPAAFGLPQATPYITQLKITEKDSCGDLSKQELGAMIRGEVEILLYTPPAP